MSWPSVFYKVMKMSWFSKKKKKKDQLYSQIAYRWANKEDEEEKQDKEEEH